MSIRVRYTSKNDVLINKIPFRVLLTEKKHFNYTFCAPGFATKKHLSETLLTL